jgi:DNA polymerase/3'-5' exonuclease PolX
LIHYGERFYGPPNKAPKYGTEADGFWSYETITWRELGVDMDELPEVEGASDVGPIKASEYLPFLIEFRKIIESQESIDKKIAEIKELGNRTALFNYFILKLNEFYKYKGDFPNSIFYNQFTFIPGVGKKSAKSLFDAGIRTHDELKNADDKTLLAIPGIGPAALKKIREFFE